MGGRPAPGRSGDRALRHAQERPPAAGRRPPRSRFQRLDVDCASTGYGGNRDVRQFLALTGVGADVLGRRRRPRPRLRRRERQAVPARALARRAGDAHAGRRLRRAERAPPRLRQRLRPARRRCGATRTTPCATPTSTRSSSGDSCRASTLPAGVRSSDVRFRSDDHYITAGQSGRQRLGDVSRYDAGGRAHVPRERRRQRLRDLRPGLRDADVRRARLPAGGHRAQLRPECRDQPGVRSRHEGDLRAAPSPQRRAGSRSTPTTRSSSTPRPAGARRSGTPARRGVGAPSSRGTAICRTA